MPDVTLTARQREILEYIDESMRNGATRPSVREIGRRSASPPPPRCTTT